MSLRNFNGWVWIGRWTELSGRSMRGPLPLCGPGPLQLKSKARNFLRQSRVEKKHLRLFTKVLRKSFYFTCQQANIHQTRLPIWHILGTRIPTSIIIGPNKKKQNSTRNKAKKKTKERRRKGRKRWDSQPFPWAKVRKFMIVRRLSGKIGKTPWKYVMEYWVGF